MEWQVIAETLINSCMDCIEDCISSISATRGKRLKEVFIACVIFLCVSVVLRIMELPAFITWQEALPAVFMSAYLTFMNCINMSVIKAVRKRLGINLKERQVGGNGS
jgi:hypothetical protein